MRKRNGSRRQRPALASEQVTKEARQKEARQIVGAWISSLPGG
ncbi:MAG: hypothetical protein RMK29_03240 [Myxococcales bacterium]|nr:hypothetical protein [Myxococcota bacterium]MDW8280699.1 hypothetical protein [Myxococcales bacterium]